jgi:hypothetical protein
VHGTRKVRREREASPTGAVGHQFLEVGLVDRHPPFPKLGDVPLVPIRADDPVTDMGQTRARDQPHVPCSYDPDVKLFCQRPSPNQFSPGHRRLEDGYCRSAHHKAYRIYQTMFPLVQENQASLGEVFSSSRNRSHR